MTFRSALIQGLLASVVGGVVLAILVAIGVIHREPIAIEYALFALVSGEALNFYIVRIYGAKNELYPGLMFMAVGLFIQFAHESSGTPWLTLLTPAGVGILAMTFAIYITRKRRA